MRKVSIQVTAQGAAAAREIDKVSDSTKKLGDAGRSTLAELDSLGQNVQLLTGSLQQLGSGLTQYVTQPILNLGKSAVTTFADLQRIKLGLVAVTGSADEAGRQFKILRKLAEQPALGLEQTLMAALKLQNAGIGFDKVTKQIEAFGNAVARSGGGRQEFERVVLAVSQIANTAFLQGDELRQLQEAGLPVIKTLREEFGAFQGKELRNLESPPNRFSTS